LRKAFENVDSYYGHRVSQKHYARPEDVDEAEYDVLLAGSDQIWNPRITGHTDPVYLLKHGKAKRRASYASSIGSVTLSEDEKEVFRECLARFDAVSVRERHAKEQLERATDKQIQVVADPTLLVKPERWSGFAASTATERIVGKPKYAIAFFVGGYTRAYAQRIRAFKTGVRAYNIQKNNRMRAGFGRVLAGVDIAAFLALIRDAEFIATDSYHAVVFSLMFQKKFVPFVNEGNSVRVAELLDRLGLKDRLNDPGSLQREIDYPAVMKRLDALRAESLDWLRGALEG
jgi:polysaccharide pyruvyl transferase WcaK-like protein